MIAAALFWIGCGAAYVACVLILCRFLGFNNLTPKE